MEKKGFQQKKTEKNQDKRDLLNVADILEFAKIVNIKEIEEVIGRQIAMNTAISEEGLRNHYGAEVGRTLLRAYVMMSKYVPEQRRQLDLMQE